MNRARSSFRQSRVAQTVRRLLCVLWVVGATTAHTQVGLAAPAAAAPATRLDGLLQQGEEQRRQIQQLEGRLAQASAAQAVRERRAAEAAAEIERLKSQPAGVTRDLALGERLAQAQVQASELAQEAGALRQRSDELRLAHRRLLATCDRILEADQDAKLPAAQRFAWLRLRTAQAEALLSDGSDAATKALAQRLGQGENAPVGSSAASELDDPQLLRERADLLRDSADKLRREVSRLQARGDELQRRQRLRERASRVDEDLFAEQSTTRRGAGRPTSGRGAETAASAPAADSSLPGPTPLGGGGATFSSGSAGATVHGGPDPSTLDGLLRVEGPGDPAVKLQALTRAQAELQSLAGDLLRRAAGLEQRAAELGRQK